MGSLSVLAQLAAGAGQCERVAVGQMGDSGFVVGGIQSNDLAVEYVVVDLFQEFLREPEKSTCLAIVHLTGNAISRLSAISLTEDVTVHRRAPCHCDASFRQWPHPW